MKDTHIFFLLDGCYLIFHFTWQISIPHQLCANSGVWQTTLMCWMCACVFKGLRQRQAVLQHSEHQKQLWIIRVQLSWPYAEALETWSSGTLLWVDKDVCHQHISYNLHTLYVQLPSSWTTEVDVSCSEAWGLSEYRNCSSKRIMTSAGFQSIRSCTRMSKLFYLAVYTIASVGHRRKGNW